MSPFDPAKEPYTQVLNPLVTAYISSVQKFIDELCSPSARKKASVSTASASFTSRRSHSIQGSSGKKNRWIASGCYYFEPGGPLSSYSIQDDVERHLASLHRLILSVPIADHVSHGPAIQKTVDMLGKMEEVYVRRAKEVETELLQNESVMASVNDLTSGPSDTLRPDEPPTTQSTAHSTQSSASFRTLLSVESRRASAPILQLPNGTIRMDGGRVTVEENRLAPPLAGRTRSPSPKPSRLSQRISIPPESENDDKDKVAQGGADDEKSGEK